MLVKEKLMMREEFSEVDIAIANYVLEREYQLKQDSVRRIAQETYVLPSSIIRFCQKLGYEGYNDFRDDYLKELKYLSSHFKNIDPNFPFKRTDKNTVVANKLATLYEETIQDCLSLIHHDSLQQAINMLNKAKHIYICASGAQVELASVFKVKMMKIGKGVVVYSHAEDIYYQACYCEQDSCFIMISYSGETDKILKVAKKIKERGIDGLAMTSYGNNTLSSLIDCCLYVSTREKLVSNLGTFGLNICIMYLLDVLYSNCFNSDYENNLDKKIKNSLAFEKSERIGGRHSDNPILKEE